MRDFEPDFEAIKRSSGLITYEIVGKEQIDEIDGDIGKMGEVLQQAIDNWRGITESPSLAKARIIGKNPCYLLHVSGYDDDPRELYDIPEVRRFVRAWVRFTKADKHPGLVPSSQLFLQVMGR